MENENPKYFILEISFLSLYEIDIFHREEKYFTTSNKNKKKKMFHVLGDPSYQYTRMKSNLNSRQKIKMNTFYRKA